MFFYSYFDHEADIGIRASGETLEEAFVGGAQAMFDLICDFEKSFRVEYTIEIHSNDLVALWIDFLNQLLAQMDIQKIFFVKCRVLKIMQGNGECSLSAVAEGVGNSGIAVKKSEVKAATFCKAAVEKLEKGYQVQCVLDI